MPKTDEERAALADRQEKRIAEIEAELATTTDQKRRTVLHQRRREYKLRLQRNLAWPQSVAGQMQAKALKASPKKPPTRRPRPTPPPKTQPPAPQRIELVAPPYEALAGVLDDGDDDQQVEQLGRITLTAEQEAVLAEPPPVGRVRFLPQTHPVLYAPHAEYTRLLNRAFGRFGWQLMATDKTLSFDGEKRCVVCHYRLFVQGVPVAAAWGQQEYRENNADQTYGDAVESTVASALRRCCKRIGVWLELWDYDWKERMVRDLGVAVKVAKGDREVTAWRRKDDPPFWNEIGRGRSTSPAPRPAPPAQTPKADNPDGDEPITPAAQKKLWDTAKRMRRSVPEVTVWLTARYGVNSSAALKRQDYNAIIAALEAPGPLQLPREPGVDDE